MEKSRFINRGVVKASVVMLMLVLARGASAAQTPVWYVQHDFSPNGIKDMDSRDSLRCLAAVDSTLFVISRIIKTTDGGATWRTVVRRYNPDGYIGRVTSVCWPTDILAMATADSGRLLRSTDGGETWDDRRMFDSNSTPYVRMIDSLHGFVFLTYVPEPRTFTTDDGGLTWQPFAVPDPPGYDVTRWVWASPTRPVRLSPSRFICIKEGRGNFRESRILITSDRGSTWDTVRTAFPGWEAYAPWEFSMRFADSLVGWAAIRRSLADSVPDARWLVSRTTDGGLTWRVVSAVAVWNRHVSPEVMWAGDSSRVMLGSSALVLRSVDGGANWSYDSTQPSLESKPTYAPLHPAGVWPVFGVNGFAVNKLLHYGSPPATTGVEHSPRGRTRLSPDAGISIVDLRVDGSLLRLHFTSRTTAPVSIHVFDMLGGVWHIRDVDGSDGSVSALDIDTGGMPPGVYGIRIVGDGGYDEQAIPLLRR